MSWTLSPAETLRILDFDIEARPLSWIAQDYVSREVTAIAASFLDEEEVHVWLLGEDDPVDMLEGFRVLYDLADIVTGHYIRKYDLPNLNGAMMEYGLPVLGPKLTSDTKTDLRSRDGISASQESLSAMLGSAWVSAPKVQMTQNDWREANRLTPEGIAKTRDRVTGDIKQHKQLRRALIEYGFLGPPVLWIP